MTPADQKLLFTALGFLAVILREGPADRQVERTQAIAGLIETYCRTAVPEAFTEKAKTDDVLLQDALAALELCLDEARLTFASEQAADSVIARIRQKIA